MQGDVSSVVGVSPADVTMLKLLMTATSFPADQGDWRGRFIYDMADSLARSGSAQLFFWGPGGDLPSGVVSTLVDDDASWLGRMVEHGGIAHLLRKRPLYGGATALGLLYRLRRVYRRFAAEGEGTAVAHVNWLQNVLSLKGVRLPVLVTVLGSDLALLRLPGMVAMLRAVLRERPAILAPNSDWMVPELQHHFGDLAEIRAIPFGIHPRWFSIERSTAAVASGDWLVVSRVTRAKLGYLLEWGEGLFGGARRLHLLGPMQEAITLPSWITYHGATNPDDLCERWFPAVTGLLTLSQHDEGRPQVMLEAMAAGLPVIASTIPAHANMLRHAETGWLVTRQADFASALLAAETEEIVGTVGAAAKAFVGNHIGTWDDCARRYIEAYRDLQERVDAG